MMFALPRSGFGEERRVYHRPDPTALRDLPPLDPKLFTFYKALLVHTHIKITISKIGVLLLHTEYGI